jgi:hypothetical protein
VAEILRADDLGDERGDEGGLDDEDGDQPRGGGTATTAGTAVKRKPGRPATKRSSQTVAVENDLRRALGVKVVVHANGKGAGRIVIPFANLDEFQRLFEHLAE